MKRALSKFCRKWGWAVILMALWAALGWDRASNVLGLVAIVCIVGIWVEDKVERLKSVEAQLGEVKRKLDDSIEREEMRGIYHVATRFAQSAQKAGVE